MKILFICKTCHKHLNKNETPYKTVYNKLILDPIPDQLKGFKNRESSNFQKSSFEKIAVMHRKAKFLREVFAAFP